MDDLIPDLLGPEPVLSTEDAARSWGTSGLLALTGRPAGPPTRGPDRLPGFVSRLADRLGELSSLLGHSVIVDGPALLGERAALSGHRRQGSMSCGGAGRLVASADGVIAVSLTREADFECVPAWLGVDSIDDPWTAVERMVARRSSAELVEQAMLLGLAVSRLGETSDARLPVRRVGDAVPRRTLDGVLVVDLSSLWAGPLCSLLLSDAGARVIKVESTRRPDGARRGPAAFFDLLTAGKESVVIDFASESGRRQLRSLVRAADVVIEGSRPRALEQLGIDASSGDATVWLSITGHGRDQAMRIGYGDDAAVAGGLAVSDERGPMFVADAVADPITGLLGAVAVLDRLQRGGRWLIDAALTRAAAAAAGEAGDIEVEPTAHPPRHRPARGTAPGFGEHTEAVLRELVE